MFIATICLAELNNSWLNITEEVIKGGIGGVIQEHTHSDLMGRALGL